MRRKRFPWHRAASCCRCAGRVRDAGEAPALQPECRARTEQECARPALAPWSRGTGRSSGRSSGEQSAGRPRTALSLNRPEPARSGPLSTSHAEPDRPVASPRSPRHITRRTPPLAGPASGIYARKGEDGDAGFRPPGPEPGPGYAGRRQNPLNASVGPPYSTGRFTAAEVLSNMALLNDRATKEAAQSCRSISFFTASASQSCHEGAFGRLEISHVMVRSRPPVKQRRGGAANRFPSMWARRSVPRKTVGLRLTN